MNAIDRNGSDPRTAIGSALHREELPKTPTGISGLDEVTGGGLPRGRATLLCGPAGCGKTLLAVEFLFRGIVEFNEPGVLVAFEESAEDLIANVASLGFDLAKAEADGHLVIDHVQVVRGEMEETGDWDLDGLFLRLGAAIDTVGAKRVVIDTIETLFGVFSNTALLRSELQRLFGWLKERGVTTIITGERGDGTLTRHGIEEYVSDCVIVLDHRVTEQLSTRRLRVLKYRGSLHGTSEYPFLITESGISVLPITWNALRYPASTERVSSGVARLDAMLDGGGFYKGSTILVNGTAGTGKTTIAAQFCASACSRGERALYLGREETEDEIMRNMISVGIDLRQPANGGLLRFECARPNLYGLEAHLFGLQKVVSEFDPAVVVIDPVSDMLHLGTAGDVSAMLTREIDFLKARGITAMITTVQVDSDLSRASQPITSLVDTWLLLKTLEGNGEINRLLYVLKSRGMGHSNQIREFVVTSQGIVLSDVYLGPEGVLTGSARQSQEAQERSEEASRREDLETRAAKLERRRESVEAQTAALWRDFEEESAAVERLLSDGTTDAQDRIARRAEQGRLRGADSEQTRHAASPVEIGAS